LIVIGNKKSDEPSSLTRKEIAGTILGLQLILLLAALDQTIITTAMPRIVADLGGFGRYAWATTSYLLASTVAVPVFGKLSDSWGRKRPLLFGVAVFVVASVLCGIAGSVALPLDGMMQLIAARALQGFAGGIILGLSFTVVGDLFSPAERGKYQGNFAAVFALASIFGPALGGYIADQFTWRWLFFVNVPVGLLAMIVFHLSFNPPVAPLVGARKVDVSGIVTFTVALLGLLLGLNWSAEGGAAQGYAAVALALSVIFGIAFMVCEAKAQDPLLPMHIFGNSVVTVSIISSMVVGIGMFGSILLIPVFLQSVMGVSAAISGALLTPLILTVAVASVVGGFVLSSLRKYKGLILLGLILMGVGTFMLSRMNTQSSLTLIVAYMMVVGTGLGLLLPVYTIVIQNAVPQEMIGTVTGFSQFFRSVGGTLGVAGFGSLMLSSYRKEMQVELPSFISNGVLQAINPLEPSRLKSQLPQLLGTVSGVTPDTIDLVLGHVRQSLVVAIDQVFFLYASLLLLTVVLSLGLEELPLRKANPNESGGQI